MLMYTHLALTWVLSALTQMTALLCLQFWVAVSPACQADQRMWLLRELVMAPGSYMVPLWFNRCLLARSPSSWGHSQLSLTPLWC